MLSFHLRCIILIYLKFSNFNQFLLEILHFLPPSFISQYHQKQRLRSNAFGVNRHLKIKKARCKSFLGFSLSFDSFRVPKTHPGHIGPPTWVNVIPGHTRNRVKDTKLVIFNFGFHLAHFPINNTLLGIRLYVRVYHALLI